MTVLTVLLLFMLLTSARSGRDKKQDSVQREQQAFPLINGEAGSIHQVLPRSARHAHGRSGETKQRRLVRECSRCKKRLGNYRKHKRRDVLWSNAPFSKFPWRGANQPRRALQKSKLVFTYEFWSDAFAVDGNASVEQSGRTMSVSFLYTVSGNTNVTVRIVRKRFNSLQHDLKDRSFVPDRSCHLQEDNHSAIVISAYSSKCFQSWGVPLPEQTNVGTTRQTTQAPDTVSGSSAASAGERQLQPRNSGSQQDEPRGKSDCPQTMTKRKLTWICLRPEWPRCFVFLVQEPLYQIKEKICPKELSPTYRRSKKLYG